MSKRTSTARRRAPPTLENVRLTIQADVAADYYQLRAQDALIQLFEATIAAYRDSLRIAQVQFQAGLASDETVAQAETQLQATQAQATNLGILRAQYEHAIALLVGQPATSFAVPAEVVPLVAAADSGGCAVPTGRTASRRRRGRAEDGPGQRAGRHRDRGVLSCR